MSEFDDPFNLFAASSASGRRTPDGREIRLLGTPLLCDDPRLHHTTVPSQYQSHPRVRGQYFYTLPPGLWDTLIAELGVDCFEAPMLEMERELSAACGDHASTVGFWQNQPIPFFGLRPSPPITFTDEQLRNAGMEPLAAQHGIRVHEDRDAVPLERYRRGYIGWLMTNPRFLDEHDALLANHAEIVRRWGTHLAGIAVPRGFRETGTDPIEDPRWIPFNTDCEAFFARWRLQSLAGPSLPTPLQALMAGQFPISVIQQLMGTGGVFYIPDTMPIPSREELRGLLDHALHRGERPEHLQEWMEMARGDNAARNQLDRFGRLFEVQHYWRLLYDRQPGALEGNVGHVEDALACQLDCSQATIHADRIEIKKRLGENWHRRSFSLAAKASA